MFYADDGVVGASDPAWLQGAFSALVAFFDRVGLRTYVEKTVSMACHPCRAGTGNRTKEGYRRKLTGVGSTFKEIHWRRLTMAARAGGYYGKAFKGARGVTQGDPLSPTIFNVIVDAVVRHWLEGLQNATEEKGATGRE